MAGAALRSRVLGSSGIEVSELSLGSWRTYERLPATAGAAVMRAARDEGITFFDDARYDDETGTAPIPTGHSEVVFGQLFRAAGLRRDEVVLANKLWWEFWPEQSAAAELDGSLERMGLDHVDLIYASAPPDGMSVGQLVESVGGLITAGKARAWGVLNWPPDVISEAAQVAITLGVAAPCAAQLPYSVARRSPVEDAAMARALGQAGIAVVASFSLEGGVLTGKYRGAGTEAGTGPGTATTPAAAGRAQATLGEPRVAPAIAAADELAVLAARLGTTSAALALAFPLRNAGVASVLFGATSPEQVRANCAAVGLLDRLGPADAAELALIGTQAGPAAGS